MQIKLAGNNLDLVSRKGRILSELTVATSNFTDENAARLIRAPIKLTAPVSLESNTVTIDKAELESAAIGGTLTGGYDLSGKAFTGDFRLFALPAVLPPDLAAKLSQTIAAGGRLTSANGDFGVEGLTVKSELIEASGALSLKGETLSADLTGALPDLGKLLTDATGKADFTVALSGNTAAPAFKASLDTKGAVLAGKTVDGKAVNAAVRAKLA